MPAKPRIAVGLGGDTIRVIGDHHIAVLFRQTSKCCRNREQLIGEPEKFVTQDRRPNRRQHILAGAPGVQQGRLDAGRFNEQWLESDYEVRPLPTWPIASVENCLQTCSYSRREIGIEQPLARIDDERSFLISPSQ